MVLFCHGNSEGPALALVFVAVWKPFVCGSEAFELELDEIGVLEGVGFGVESEVGVDGGWGAGGRLVWRGLIGLGVEGGNGIGSS